MKFLTTPISGQHLVLKAAILITGLVSGLDSSLGQLLKEGALFLLILLIEPVLFRSLLKAVKTIIPFLAAYWMFSTLFGQIFPKSVLFSVQILYLLLVTVYVFARPDFVLWAQDCRWIRKVGWIDSIFVFCLSTLLFVRRFFAEFRMLSSVGGTQMLVSSVADVFHNVASDSGKISDEVGTILGSESLEKPQRFLANSLGIIFFALLVIVHGV